MSVRRATPADAAAIARVHVRSWQVAYRGLMPDELLDGLSVADREEMWRAEAVGQGDAGLLLVAEQSDGLVGFCAVAMPSRDEGAADATAEIGAIYVDPDLWRTGAGRALMDAAIAELEGEGWHEVTLWVLEGNQPALDFYDRFGFAADGARKLYGRSGTVGIRLRRSLGGAAAGEHAGR